MRKYLVSTILGAVLATGVAHAETPPNSWDKLKDPALDEAYAVHLLVQRNLFQNAMLEDDGYDPRQMRKFALDACLLALRNVHADTSADYRLRSDYLEVLRQRDNLFGEDHTAERLGLAQALCNDDRVPARESSSACFDLALLHAKHGKTEDEIAAYAIGLRREADPLQRAVIVMNRAEGYMRLGNLHDAIEGYREVLTLIAELGRRSDTGPSASWGLAVALDRYRDPRGAMEAATNALMSDPNMFLVSPGNGPGQNNNVFFVPEWDAHWYRAIGWRAKAQQPSLPVSIVAIYLGKAESEYAEFVRKAEAANDTMYLGIAKERLASVSKLHADAVKRAGVQRSFSSAGVDF